MDIKKELREHFLRNYKVGDIIDLNNAAETEFFYIFPREYDAFTSYSIFIDTLRDTFLLEKTYYKVEKGECCSLTKEENDELTSYIFYYLNKDEELTETLFDIHYSINKEFYTKKLEEIIDNTLDNARYCFEKNHEKVKLRVGYIIKGVKS